MTKSRLSGTIVLALSFQLSAFSSPLSSLAATEPPGGLASLQDSFANVASKAKPAVVHITTVHEETVRLPQFFFGDPEDFFQEFFEGRPQQPRVQRFRTQGSGSGFIIDPKGFVLTNEHVVRGADELHVILTLPSGKERTYPGRVAGKDPYLDLAVVKILGDNDDFPYVGLGDSDKVRVGDWALAIGSPFALGQTVTAGIISAIKQTLVIEGRRYNDLLQTDAAINRGNSGGPLLDLNGKVIGINSAIYSPSGAFAGIGFAIPINAAKDTLAALEAGKAAPHGWLGIEVAQIDEVIQKRFALPGSEGALVNRVVPKSPAEKAGLRRGDVIRKLGGEPVTAPEDLVRIAAKAKPGAALKVTLIRDGKTLEASVKVGERPETGEAEAEVQPAEKPGKGAGYRWEGVDFGAEENRPIVLDVASDSKLFGYLLPKDLIAGVNQTDVSDLPGLRRALGQASLSEGVVFDIVRNGQPMYISVQQEK